MKRRQELWTGEPKILVIFMVTDEGPPIEYFTKLALWGNLGSRCLNPNCVDGSGIDRMNEPII